MATATRCRGCKEVHDPLLRCDQARRIREANLSAESSRVTHKVEPPAARPVVDIPKVVDTVVDAVSHANPVVVDGRRGDRHRKTAARRLYLRLKQRESRARRATGRVSG
jgi:hypothetical protein